jgi:glycosyltransferase involved in cell wall biosynthesis
MTVRFTEGLHRRPCVQAPDPSIVRIVIDLQACQTEGSKGRGVGRYSEGLATQIARQIGSDDLRLSVNSAYDDSIDGLIDTFGLLVQRQQLSAYRYPRIARQIPGKRSTAVALADALVRRHWMSLQPDVLHVSHLFEGWIGEAVVPHSLPKVAGVVRSATLFDLIPLRFPEHYLVDPLFKRWYFEKLGTLRECDQLLAISESTRTDAIELLGINPDRITTIWGGVERGFRRKELSPMEIGAFRVRHGVRGRFVLYTGGDEYRKNLDGALTGYAELPASLRDDIQFVIVCAIATESRTALLDKANKLGLAADQVLITGFVAAEDLVIFYSLCDAFVFPSFYEGLGLPLLEAMNCGAPTLGADNSSIREIIVRQDAMFDPHKPATLAERLAKVLIDEDFRDDLRRHGTLRAKEFTWERSARNALEAMRAAHRRLDRATPVAIAATLAKRRLALFTPLPPCRSGIADYNATFLPFLSRYFDIDLFIDDYDVTDAYLRANYAIRSHRDFPARRQEYEIIIYEMGNSEFHGYMLDYIARYPGIVVLHDAFLSGLYGYLDFNLGQAGRYSREMLTAHATRARRCLAPVQEAQDPIGAAMLELPATKTVIDDSIGVISHSIFNLKIAQENYPEGWAAPYRIINQMVRAPSRIDGEQRRANRVALGFDETDFVVSTFGHIAWTKCGDILLEAFERSPLSRDPKAKLVYVGEMSQDAFGHKLGTAISGGRLRRRITVTGYVEEAVYAQYLIVADVAVQLRTHSRGGTPKSVLDCLAHGVPVIVNHAASYTDYPDDAVQKIGAEPNADELADELTRLYERRTELAQVGATGREYVIRAHGPEAIAAQYALAVDEFAQRHKTVSLPGAVRELSDILARGDARTKLHEDGAVVLYESLTRKLFARQRILIDVTHIVDADHETGIPRVVKNIVRWLYCSDRAGFTPIAVHLVEGSLVVATDWLTAQGLSVAGEEQEPRDRKIDLQWGDCLLMLDSSWARIGEFMPLFESIRQVHGNVYTVIYDLLPIHFPQLMVPGGPEWFRGWLRQAIDASDGLICISRSVAEELDAFVRTHGLSTGRLRRLGFWHLGCDFSSELGEGSIPSDRVRRATSSPTFLMVGSLDPRKNHALVLEAMQTLWARGVNVNLCIAGKRGWMVDDFVARLLAHPELGRRLHFIERPTDSELRDCYVFSTALLFASAGEGFGLPIVEAAHFDTPIIASDIPVSREIAGQHATYFPLGPPEEIAAVLETWLQEAATGRVPKSSGMHCLTWDESARQLLEVILDNRWYKVLSDS